MSFLVDWDANKRRQPAKPNIAEQMARSRQMRAYQAGDNTRVVSAETADADADWCGGFAIHSDGLVLVEVDGQQARCGDRITRRKDSHFEVVPA